MATIIKSNSKKGRIVETPCHKEGPLQKSTLGANIPTDSPKTLLDLKPRPHGKTGKV